MEFVAYARKIPPKAQVLLSLIDVVAEECLQRLRPELEFPFMKGGRGGRMTMTMSQALGLSY